MEQDPTPNEQARDRAIEVLEAAGFEITGADAGGDGSIWLFDHKTGGEVAVATE